MKSKVKLEKGFDEIRRMLEAEQSPFGKATAKQKKERKAKALASLRYFAETYFPHYLTAPPSKMHLEMYDQFQRIIEEAAASGEGLKLAKAAPRGNAKSTLTTLILPLWCIIGKLRKFPVILSDTTDQANEFLEFIKAELEVNERLAEDFPEAVGEGPRWKIGDIVTRNGVRVKCYGSGKRLRGARHGSVRPDLVICDDLEDDESVQSPEQRAKREGWFFRALMKIGQKDTVFIVVGTILHYDSLLAKLLNRGGWTASKWQAVIRWSASALWDTWTNLYTVPGNEKEADRFFSMNRDEMLRDTEVLWPEVEDYYYLMKMRVSDGPSFFDSEKQNEPINPDDCLFQESWFTYLEDYEVQAIMRKSGYEFYAALDPSMGKKSKRADPSALLVAAVGKAGYIDIIEAVIKKSHPDAQMELLFSLHEIFNFTRVAIEEVQFQELFKDNIEKEGKRRRLYLPVVGVRPHIDKTLRISKLQPQIKNGVIRINRKLHTLIDQLRYFPKAAHDDGPDALEMIFNLVKAGKGGPRVRRLDVAA